jgi:HPt (histidine-containing phosphotransfer) domain-containing protein
MQVDKERCMAAGMNGYVSKPINPEELWRALLAWVKPRSGLGLAQPSATAAVAPATVAAAPAQQHLPVLQALRGVPGLDVNRGLSLSNQNAGLYLAMLGKFVKSQANTVDAIRQALAADDASTAERLAHTLKGLSASMGAEPLRQTLSGVELAIHTGSDSASLAPVLDTAAAQLQALVAAVRATPGLFAEAAPPEAQATPTPQSEVQAVVQALRTLLEQDDSEVQTLWDSHAGALHSALPQAQALEQAIQEFDFEAALRLMPAAA